MDKPTCELNDCGLQRHGRMPWCKKHYNRWRRTGDPQGRPAPAQHVTADDGTVTKECRTCKTQRPIDAYGPDRRLFDGLSRECRDCRNIRLREWSRAKVDQDPAFREKRSQYWQKFRQERGDEWARKRNREHKLQMHYGITVEQYDEMLARQGGRCAICRRTSAEAADVRKEYGLAVDHCHDTGRVRGLLCSSCNFGLGNFQDSADLLHEAVEYLKRSAS